MTMKFDCIFNDAEIGGDLFVEATRDDSLQNFAFPLCKGGESI